MESNITLYGFSLLRNGEKYDYCYKESLASLSGLVKKIYLALGDCEDNTPLHVKQINNIEIKHTIWNPESRKSGLILSEQTNIALDFLKSSIHNIASAWGFYLQADEVIHQDDYYIIKQDIESAHNHGYDAVSFRYLHYWQNHHTIAIGKKWYPVEVRAIRLDAPILSCKDAQGFEGIKKIYFSRARIYHYGHVRRQENYKLKKEAFHKLYHDKEASVRRAQIKEDKKYLKGGFLNYYGKQPIFMKQRIESFGEPFTIPKVDCVILKNIPEDIITKNIQAEQIIIEKKLTWEMFKHPTIIMKKNIMESILFPSKVKLRPESKLGPDWDDSLYFELLLSEKNIGINNELKK